MQRSHFGSLLLALIATVASQPAYSESNAHAQLVHATSVRPDTRPDEGFITAIVKYDYESLVLLFDRSGQVSVSVTYYDTTAKTVIATLDAPLEPLGGAMIVGEVPVSVATTGTVISAVVEVTMGVERRRLFVSPIILARGLDAPEIRSVADFASNRKKSLRNRSTGHIPCGPTKTCLD